MVVHEDTNNTNQVPVIQMPRSERKKFLVVDNHVREIPIVRETSSSTNTENDTTESELKNKKKKRIKKQLASSISQEKNTSEISDSDLLELKTVYLKCKEVVEKIENKYGHLLNLDGGNSSRQHKRKSDEELEKCVCETNKKIVFDDNGEQMLVDTVPLNYTHICAKKLKAPPEHSNIEITYDNTETQLPDSIQELQNLLRKPDLGNTYRYQIVCKIRSLRQEVSNEIKFNKPSLIEKLKTNPDEILDFKGTNLASIPGYL